MGWEGKGEIKEASGCQDWEAGKCFSWKWYPPFYIPWVEVASETYIPFNILWFSLTFASICLNQTSFLCHAPETLLELLLEILNKNRWFPSGKSDVVDLRGCPNVPFRQAPPGLWLCSAFLSLYRPPWSTCITGGRGNGQVDQGHAGGRETTGSLTPICDPQEPSIGWLAVAVAPFYLGLGGKQ